MSLKCTVSPTCSLSLVYSQCPTRVQCIMYSFLPACSQQLLYVHSASFSQCLMFTVPPVSFWCSPKCSVSTLCSHRSLCSQFILCSVFTACSHWPLPVCVQYPSQVTIKTQHRQLPPSQTQTYITFFTGQQSVSNILPLINNLTIPSDTLCSASRLVLIIQTKC